MAERTPLRRRPRRSLAGLIGVAAFVLGACGAAAVAPPVIPDPVPDQAQDQPQPPVEPDDVPPAPADEPAEDAAARLLGAWLGPVPGDQGRCGTASGAFFFQSDNSYAYNQQTMECGGFTSGGTYAVNGSTIAFRQQQVYNCPTCTQTAQFSVTFSFPTADALEICEPTGCYTYHRQ